MTVLRLRVATDESVTAPPPPRPMPERVIEAAAKEFFVEKRDVMGFQRTKSIANARHVAMFLMREIFGFSYPELGRRFRRDHTTIMSACKRVARNASTNRAFADSVERVRRKVLST